MSDNSEKQERAQEHAQEHAPETQNTPTPEQPAGPLSDETLESVAGGWTGGCIPAPWDPPPIVEPWEPPTTW